MWCGRREQARQDASHVLVSSGTDGAGAGNGTSTGTSIDEVAERDGVCTAAVVELAYLCPRRELDLQRLERRAVILVW